MMTSKASRIGVLALASAATLAAVWQVHERDKRLSGSEAAGGRDSVLRTDAVRSRAGSDADAENWLSLLRRLPIASQTAGELFSSGTWTPPPAPAPPAAKPVETPPPFPFVYLGKSVLDGATRLYLTKAVAPNAPPGPVFMVSSGDTLDGAYRVDSVTDEGLAVTYLPMNKPQTMTFASLVANAGQPQSPRTPQAAAPSSYSPSAQAYVPQPLAATAPANTSASGGGAAFGGGSTGAAAPALSAGASTSAFSSAASTGTATGTGASTGGVTSATSPGAAPAGALGSQPVGSGILGVAVNNNSPIGFNGAISPGSMPTGSSAPRGPGPITK